jgi:trans-aconitate methyltransferase
MTTEVTAFTGFTPGGQPQANSRNWAARARRVLDIGCGSGQPIAVYLASSGHPVTGIYSSPELTALFHDNLATTAAEVADMRSLSLGTRFGGLILWDGFFHLAPDEQRPFPRPCLAGCTAAVHQRP